MTENFPILKVCGMKEIEQIMSLDADKIKYIGFIFFPPSPRNAYDIPLSTFKAAGEKFETVGVFVDENIETVCKICSDRDIDTIQLHGSESPEFCSELKAQGYHIIKAFRISPHMDGRYLNASLHKYDNCVDFFLFDTAGEKMGGNGTKFNWEILDCYTGSTPFIISGGIGIDDIDKMKKIAGKFGKKLVGFDINSKFETSPGQKDVVMINKLISELYG